MWRKIGKKPLLLRLQNIWTALTPGSKLWLPLCRDLHARKPMAKTKIQWLKWLLWAGSSSCPCLPSRDTFCSTLQAGTLKSDLCIQSPPPTLLLFPSKASQRSQNLVQQHHWQPAAGLLEDPSKNILFIKTGDHFYLTGLENAALCTKTYSATGRKWQICLSQANITLFAPSGVVWKTDYSSEILSPHAVKAQLYKTPWLHQLPWLGNCFSPTNWFTNT